jgi:hypothetical protein
LFNADEEKFFMRFEEKYGLQEINIDKIDMKFSLDYSILTLPPVFVDYGTISFQCEDVSLNTVWKLNLNSTKFFFDIDISHLLIQIVPNKFDFTIDSYSDLARMVNKQFDLIIEYTLNEILAM